MKLIKNAKIVCPVQGVIEDGGVLFDDEKIHGVGNSLTAPEGCETIDARGKYVLPGYIDAHAHHGLFDGTIGWAGEDGNEKTAACTPEIRGIDSFNPFDAALADLMVGGVTCVNTGPGSGNVISGEALVFKPGGAVVDEMTVMAPSGLKVALGENPKRLHGQMNKRMPSTRMGVAALLRKSFTEAQHYLAEQEAYSAKRREAKQKGETPPAPPKRDLGMESMARVLNQEIPIHAHAHRADDIATVIRVAEEFDIPVVLIHCTEGHKLADYIAARGIPAVVGPTIYWTSKPETRERSFETVAILHRAGVKVALQTDSLTPMNYFPLLPMQAVKQGVSREDALKLVTLNPAEILNIQDRVGSLEPGKDADVVIWSGDPLDFYSRVEKMFVDGKEIYSQ
jgi:imidazolonepropionase-like amidohydrolase